MAGRSGIVFSVLSLIVLPLVAPTAPPALGSSGAAFSFYFDDHRFGFLLGNYLGVAAFFPGFVQLVVLASRFRRVEGPTGWFSSLILTTGTFAYAVFACSLVVFQVLPFVTASHSEAHALGSLASVWFALDGLAALPLVLAVGWAAREAGVLPAWFARFSALVAALLLAMSAGSMTVHPAWLAGGGVVTGIGFIAFFAWTFVLGILFLRNLPPDPKPCDKSADGSLQQ